MLCNFNVMLRRNRRQCCQAIIACLLSAVCASGLLAKITKQDTGHVA